MRKLKLDVDDLTVDSFEAVADRKERGTVRGQDSEESWDWCRTDDPRLRECYTPYVECATDGYTCTRGYCCPSGFPVCTA